MNHTIKGIIIVAAITSMLVVGANMFPIMQNSFASKKHDFKGADRDPNTNTNTNSADSTSSSSATASNTNNISNTATASNNQEQSACAIALTCPEGSTTVTPPTPTGTLLITLQSCRGCDETAPVTVTGNNPRPSSLNLHIGETQPVTLGPGSYSVRFQPPGIVNVTIFHDDCTQTVREVATGTISAGQTQHCTIIAFSF